MEDGQYFSLSEIGGKVWELCDGNHNISQIVAALAGNMTRRRMFLSRTLSSFSKISRTGS